MTAVVAERHGVGENQIRPDSTGDGHGTLRHLDGVSQSGALVVGRIHDHLGLACQPSERGRVHDTVPVTLKTGAELTGFLLLFSLSRPGSKGCRRVQADSLQFFTFLPTPGRVGHHPGCRVTVGHHHIIAVAAHGPGPFTGPGERFIHHGKAYEIPGTITSGSPSLGEFNVRREAATS